MKHLTLEELVARTKAWREQGLLPRKKERPPVALPVYTPCQFEGAVVEYCMTCNGEMKHVRRCEHEGNPTEKCTRVRVGDLVWACSDCTYRSVA